MAKNTGVARRWSQRDRRLGARLLVEIRQFLSDNGVQSIDSPRVADDLRGIWNTLIGNSALHSLPKVEAERISWMALCSRAHVAQDAYADAIRHRPIGHFYVAEPSWRRRVN